MTHRNVALLCNNASAVRLFRGPLVREMVRRSCRVRVFAPDFTTATRAQVVELGAEPVEFVMERAGANPLKDLLVIFRLARQLRGLKIDTCLGFMTKLVIYGSLASLFAGVQNRYAMVEGLGYFFTEDGARKAGARKALIRAVITTLYRVSLPLNRALFFLNPDDARELTARGVMGGTPATVLDGIGIDIREYSGEPPVGGAVKFLMISRLLREKGVREYVAAAEMLKREYPEVGFTIVGPEDVNPGGIGAAVAREWVARGAVEWPGPTSDSRPWYRGASVYVLPSYREGMPRTTLEAMAMARSIITTDVPGCRETIKRMEPGETSSLKPGRVPATGRVVRGRNGFLVPPRDVEALAEAMEQFIIDPQLGPRMGAESRRLAEERFEVGKVNEKIMQVMGL